MFELFDFSLKSAETLFGCLYGNTPIDYGKRPNGRYLGLNGHFGKRPYGRIYNRAAIAEAQFQISQNLTDFRVQVDGEGLFSLLRHDAEIVCGWRGKNAKLPAFGLKTRGNACIFQSAAWGHLLDTCCQYNALGKGSLSAVCRWMGRKNPGQMLTGRIPNSILTHDWHVCRSPP